MKLDYPKTYEECCSVLGVTANMIDDNIDLKYNTDALRDLLRVIICKNAYLKIAELNDVKFGKERYIIKSQGDAIVKDATSETSYILSFPTESMRDAFLDNFEKDILKVSGIL